MKFHGKHVKLARYGSKFRCMAPLNQAPKPALP